MSTDGRASCDKSTFRQEVSVTIAIDAPRERVWSLLTNAEDFPRWNSTVTSIEGTISRGERIALRVPISDRTFKLTIVEAEAPARMVWADGFAPMFRGVRTFTLAEEGAGTRFTMTEVMSGLMFPMIVGSLPDFREPFEIYARDLKREAEGG